MSAGIWILYEDQRDDDVKGFGPHQLVVACVADALGCEPWALKGLLRDKAMKSNSKMRLECQERLDRLVRDGSHVIAVYDADRACDVPTPKLAKSSCKQLVVQGLKQGCEPGERLRIVLLEQNIETVLAALRRLGPDLAENATFEVALRHKGSRAARDNILGKAAAPNRRPLRSSLQHEVPSIAYLVGKIVAILREDLRAFSGES